MSPLGGQYCDQGEGHNLGFDNSIELSTLVLVGGLELIDVLLEDSKIWVIRKHFLNLIAGGNLYLLVRKGSFEVNAHELIQNIFFAILTHEDGVEASLGV